MQFSKMAAKFLPDVEISEKHHDQKLDAPAGTAKETISMINNVRERKEQGHPKEFESMHGARGAKENRGRIHRVRLHGSVAHQEVIFGGDGQTLTIKHDSFNRKSFMSGIKLAVEHVVTISSLVYGLENIMDINH